MKWQTIAELIRTEYDNVRDPEVPTAAAVALESVVIGLGNSYLTDDPEFPVAAFHTGALGHSEYVNLDREDWRRGHRINEPRPGVPEPDLCPTDQTHGGGYTCTNHDGPLHLGYGSVHLCAMWDDEHHATTFNPGGRLHSVKEQATS